MSIKKMLAMLPAMALGLCSFAMTANAQQYTLGHFTLPFETRWGTAELAAGHYSMVLDSMNGTPVISLKCEDRGVAFVIGAISDVTSVRDKSYLVIVQQGGRNVVQTLNLGARGRVFEYAMPKDIKEGRQLRIPI